ncbi:hypothetical protein ILYODFUR_010507 [Ilyodon furcidens]|uniref:Peptidase A2 domain-containing protein n=1 Tax=Ilyodon furcidens TaxID=33524 RepID=A0ABV0T783_9TELE
MLLGCGKYLFTLIDNGADVSFTNSNCFCPTNVSQYQSPVGEVLVGLQIRAIKPQRPDSFSYYRLHKKEEKKKHQTDCNNLRGVCGLCFKSCILSVVKTMFKETKLPQII